MINSLVTMETAYLVTWYVTNMISAEIIVMKKKAVVSSTHSASARKVIKVGSNELMVINTCQM